MLSKTYHEHILREQAGFLDCRRLAKGGIRNQFGRMFLAELLVTKSGMIITWVGDTHILVWCAHLSRENVCIQVFNVRPMVDLSAKALISMRLSLYIFVLTKPTLECWRLWCDFRFRGT